MDIFNSHLTCSFKSHKVYSFPSHQKLVDHLPGVFDTKLCTRNQNSFLSISHPKVFVTIVNDNADMFQNLKRRISNENMKFKLAKRSVKLWAYRPPFHITVFHFWKLFKQCMQATWTIWISNRSKGRCEIRGFYITVQFFWKPFKLFPLLFGLGEIRTNKEQSLIYIRYISLYIDDHNYVQIFTLYFQNIFLFQNTAPVGPLRGSAFQSAEFQNGKASRRQGLFSISCRE